MIRLIREIAKRKQVQDELEQANARLRLTAIYGGLAQVPNRRHFVATLEKEWRRLQRVGQSLALVMLDIDHLKPYNDTNGRPAGDDCLLQVAQLMHSVVNRSSNLLARYGGEELRFFCQIPKVMARRMWLS